MLVCYVIYIGHQPRNESGLAWLQGKDTKANREFCKHWHITLKVLCARPSTNNSYMDALHPHHYPILNAFLIVSHLICTLALESKAHYLASLKLSFLICQREFCFWINVLHAYCVPDTVVGTGGIAAGMMEKYPCPYDLALIIVLNLVRLLGIFNEIY